MSRRLVELPVADLIPTPDNPREVVGRLGNFEDLVASVRAVGVLVPVLARPHPEQAGKWDVRAGARRLAAARQAGRETVPAIVDDAMTDAQAFEATFLENFGREDLTPMEQARAVEVLLDRYGHDLPAVASKLGWTERAVRARIRLIELSPGWQRAARDQASPVSRATVAHLELVARLPRDVQEALLDLEDGEGVISDWNGAILSVEDTRARIAGLTHALPAATWDLEDANVAPGRVACALCNLRTDSTHQMGLWDEETAPGGGKAKKHGPVPRCLNEACWREKAAATVERKAKTFAAEHPDGVLVSRTVHAWDRDGLKRLQEERPGAVASESREEVGRKTPGAVPTLVLDGAEAGRVVWTVQAERGRAGAASAGASGAGERPEGQPMTLAARRLVLNSKRWARLIVLLRERVAEANLPVGEDTAPTPAGAVLRLAVAFGTRTSASTRGGYRSTGATCDPWKQLATLRRRPNTPKEGIDLDVRDLWPEVRDVLLSRLSHNYGVTQIPDDLIEEAKRVADLVGADWKAMLREVSEAKGFQEPAAWAGLNEDGTPKTPAAAKRKG